MQTRRYICPGVDKYEESIVGLRRESQLIFLGFLITPHMDIFGGFKLNNVSLNIIEFYYRFKVIQCLDILAC